MTVKPFPQYFIEQYQWLRVILGKQGIYHIEIIIIIKDVEVSQNILERNRFAR
jgi:hypothetical protein